MHVHIGRLLGIGEKSKMQGQKTGTHQANYKQDIEGQARSKQRGSKRKPQSTGFVMAGHEDTEQILRHDDTRHIKA